MMLDVYRNPKITCSRRIIGLGAYRVSRPLTKPAIAQSRQENQTNKPGYLNLSFLEGLEAEGYSVEYLSEDESTISLQ